MIFRDDFFPFLGALPDTDGHVAAEVQVTDGCALVSDLEAVALAHHHMEGGPELLVHGLLDHARS